MPHRNTFVVLAALTALLCPSPVHGAGSLWLVGDGEADVAVRALARTRIEHELARARVDYANSRFEACARRLARLEQRARWQLRAAEDLPRMRQLNLWLGLCHAVDGQPDQARAAFSLAARLPGSGPDPALFPPAVMELFRAAQAARGGCRLRTASQGGGLLLDGRQVEPGAEVAPGEHYAVWDGQSDRRRVEGECRLDLATPVPTQTLRLDPPELASAAFLQALGRAAGVKELVVAESGARGVTLGVFDVGARRFTRRGAPLLGAAAPAGSTPACTEAVEEPAPGSAWYRRWWVWTLVAAGVATAVIVPVALTQPGSTRYEVGF